MIFVTVGTHEQQFNRLVKAVDDLKKDGIITDDVFIQTGYSTYEPEYCKSKKFCPYKEMEKMYQNSDIIITHGGPSSFIQALSMGKIPIVVPRQSKFGEHINDHQIEFCAAVSESMNSIILIEDIDDLGKVIRNYNKYTSKLNKNISSNNEQFNSKLDIMINL